MNASLVSVNLLSGVQLMVDHDYHSVDHRYSERVMMYHSIDHRYSEHVMMYHSIDHRYSEHVMSITQLTIDTVNM